MWITIYYLLGLPLRTTSVVSLELTRRRQSTTSLPVWLTGAVASGFPERFLLLLLTFVLQSLSLYLFWEEKRCLWFFLREMLSRWLSRAMDIWRTEGQAATVTPTRSVLGQTFKYCCIKRDNIFIYFVFFLLLIDCCGFIMIFRWPEWLCRRFVSTSRWGDKQEQSDATKYNTHTRCQKISLTNSSRTNLFLNLKYIPTVK